MTLSNGAGEPTGSFAEIPGHRVHYIDAGHGDPIVLLHGSGPGATAWTNFRLNIEALAESFRVIAVDMPGWGKSSTVDDATRDHPADLVALLDTIGIEAATLVGNSMGAHTSILTAIRYPSRVKRMVTLGSPSPRPPLFAPAGPPEGLEILYETYLDPSPVNFKRLVKVMCYDQRFATDELAASRAAAVQGAPQHVESFVRIWRSSDPDDYWMGMGDRLGEIDVPTLLIHGRDDRVLPYEHSLNLLSMIPGSELVLLNRCGHWVQIEHATEFNRLVGDFAAAA